MKKSDPQAPHIPTRSPNLERATEKLQKEGFTCVIFKGDSCFTSRARGVRALIEWLDAGIDVSGGSAADRVVGNGAAFLYVLLGVKEVYAEVISRSAKETLAQHGISVTYQTFTEAIVNRQGNGPCPIEAAVAGECDPSCALEKIRQRLAALAKQTTET